MASAEVIRTVSKSEQNTLAPHRLIQTDLTAVELLFVAVLQGLRLSRLAYVFDHPLTGPLKDLKS